MRIPVPQLSRPSLPPLKMPQWLQRLFVHTSHIEKIVLGWLLLVLLISGALSVSAYINRHTELVPQSGGIYREAAVGQPRYINPVLAGASDLDVDIAKLVYSSLFRFDNNLNLQPDLATSYELTENDTKYIIHLRNDVRWHDGEAFNADDVVFTIASIQTPEYGSPLQSAFQGVIVEKIDDQTVSFKLKQPYSPFLASLTVGIVPQHVWEHIAPKNASLAEQMLKPVGTGPFKFTESKTRRKTGEITEYRLTRNESYYGQRPYLDEIKFLFFNSHDEAIQAFLASKVDGVGFLPLQRRDQIARRSTQTIHRLRLPQYYGLFFNQQKGSILADTNVRNSLDLGTDREALVRDALQGEGEILHLPIPSGVFAFNDELGIPNYDPERAKQNLEDGGWKDTDNDGIREKNSQKLHITITTTDWPEYIKTAELMQQQWRALGVDVAVESYGAGTIQQTIIRPRSYEALLFGQILPAIPDPYPFWHSSQTASPGLNFSLFKNETVDKLLEEARKTTDMTARQEKYKEFQGIIRDVKPALILYRPYYLYATKSFVKGMTDNYAANTAGRFDGIEQWHVKTKRVWK